VLDLKGEIMPYKDIRKARRFAREAMRRKRMGITSADIKQIQNVIPDVIPKLPWYAGASDHFGEVKSHYYAEQFFSNLFQGVS